MHMLVAEMMLLSIVIATVPCSSTSIMCIIIHDIIHKATASRWPMIRLEHSGFNIVVHMMLWLLLSLLQMHLN